MTDQPIWPGEDDSTRRWAAPPYASAAGADDATRPASGPAGQPGHPGPAWPAAATDPSTGRYPPFGQPAYGPTSYGQPPFGPPFYGSAPSG
ncbi:MAG: hypothetical protein ABSE77_20370, partial [Acidimicrobiales bacterium]